MAKSAISLLSPRVQTAMKNTAALRAAGPHYNKGASKPIPKTYDQNWQSYMDLSPAQKQAFQVMPEWLLSYTMLRHAYYLSAASKTVTPANAAAFMEQLAGAAVATVAGIHAATPSITTEAQIDTALSAITPAT